MIWRLWHAQDVWADHGYQGISQEDRVDNQKEAVDSRDLPLTVGDRARRRSNAVSFIIVLVAAASVMFWITNTSAGLSMSKSWSGASCRDPYEMPGFLYHNSSARGTARWIPLDVNVIDKAGSSTPAPQRDDSFIPEGVLEASAAPALMDALKSGDRRVRDDLAFMRGKTVLILGCSIDRVFLESFCKAQRGDLVALEGGWHGVSSCTIADLDFNLQLWFTYGASFGSGDNEKDMGPRNFEERVRDHWRPKVRAAGYRDDPDMIIWSSGTWDVLVRRLNYYNQVKDRSRWREQALSWQEVTWHRRRLSEMARFIEAEYPNVPALYRPPSYLQKIDLPSHNGMLYGVDAAAIDYLNEGVFRVNQNVKALSELGQLRLFPWAEKLVGHAMYADTVHFHHDSYAQWLYGDMMLYYLRQFSSRLPVYCWQ